jgi:hypothetical protein
MIEAVAPATATTTARIPTVFIFCTEDSRPAENKMKIAPSALKIPTLLSVAIKENQGIPTK